MSKINLQEQIKNLLREADIQINGNRPWDIQIKNPDFYSHVLADGSLSLGESYMNGWWDSKAIDQFMEKILLARLNKKIKNSKNLLWNIAKAKIFNQQNISRSKIVGKKHYDIGNELYKNMLDSRMNYSCGYWQKADNLEDTQIVKLELTCKKLQLKPGMRLLDIGCGWGAMSKYAAKNYGVKVVGITISKKQARLAKEMCQGYDVDIRLDDYRNINEKFDRIVSIGMLEHVGYKNHRSFMQIADKSLKKDGIFLLHTIGGNESIKTGDSWISKYIFPNGLIPSPVQIIKSAEGLFRLEDWHNFGDYYDNTLMAWHKNFNDNWDKIKNKYDEKFKRMWNYYLLICAASFRARNNQLWQIVFTKPSSNKKYKNIR